MILQGALSVFRFEFRRTLTVGRLGVWLFLALFPVFVVSIMKYYEKDFEGGPGVMAHNSTNINSDGSIEKFERRRNGVEIFEEMAPGEKVFTIRRITMPDGRLVVFPRNDAREPGESVATVEEIQAALVAAGRQDAPEASDGPRYPPELWGMVIFFLIPEVITLFSLLLWVTPMVHSELEGRTWIYLASRPRGRVSVLLGKYLTAVTWTMLAGGMSTTACVLIARPDEPMNFWMTVMALVVFSCVSYASLYSLFGVLFRRRAMVIAVAYTLIFEFLVSMIPAVINQLTVQYRLRNLLFAWMNWRTEASTDVRFIMRDMEIFLGTEPAWQHVAILVGISVGLLIIAAQVIQRMEYVTAADA